jgi:two-component system, NtrC family, sensor histidine kinase HydH
VEPFAKIDQLPLGLDIIAAVGNVIQSSRGIESILSDIIGLVTEIMATDECSIWLYEDGVLNLKASRGFCTICGEVTLALGEGVVGRVAETREPISIGDVRVDERYKPLPGAGSERCLSILSVPMTDADKLVGVLSVNTFEPYEYTESERSFMAFIASQLVGAIRNTQLYAEVIKGFREMAIIHQVGQIVNSVRDLDELLSIIARTCAEHLSTRGCILRLLSPETQELEVKGLYGLEMSAITKASQPLGVGIAGKCAAERKPIVRIDMSNDPDGYIEGLNLRISSVICVPLLVKGSVTGTLAVYDKLSPFSNEPARFEQDDVGLVQVIGMQIAMAIENARLYAEKDVRIRELSLLLEITNMMRGNMDLDDLLYIILTSVTMAEGLGFNRALLFLNDDRQVSLVGKMAVGPLRAEEAARHWTAINPKGKTLQEIVTEYGQFNRNAGFEIDRRVKGAAIPIREDKGVIACTVLERKSFNVSNYAAPAGSEEALLAEMGFTVFATAPLLAKDRAIGVIVVDNLVNKKPITVEHIRFLQLFANQAASAIETNRVYKNLERMNKRLVDARDMLVRTKTLATLGEFSAGIAHELRNPLVAIGGFAKRLLKSHPEDSREARYARIIATEVEGMEKILNQILDFAGGAKAERRRVDIAHLIEHVFVLFNELLRKYNIKVEPEYEEGARYLYVDEVQMRQLFINLIKNAIEAMKDGGTLRIHTTLIGGGGDGVGFEVEDTGVGIPAESIEHVFDPFFTSKSTGTGLGLTMCSRIVESNHGGRMFIESKVGRGTSVMIWLPPDVLREPEEQTAPPRHEPLKDEQSPIPDSARAGTRPA